jgi:hypothetical protein
MNDGYPQLTHSPEIQQAACLYISSIFARRQDILWFHFQLPRNTFNQPVKIVAILEQLPMAAVIHQGGSKVTA